MLSILAQKAGEVSYVISDFNVEYLYDSKNNLKYNYISSLADRDTAYVGIPTDYTTI